MKKYEEPRYQWGEICEHIYPWVKKELTDTQALNGKHFSEKDAPVVAFLGDLKIIFVIKRQEDTYEVLKEDVRVVRYTYCNKTGAPSYPKIQQINEEV